MWPLPPVGSALSILASAPLASAPLTARVSALQDLGATADTPLGLALASWADIVAVEEEEQERAGRSAIPVDLRPELRDLDLINTV